MRISDWSSDVCSSDLGKRDIVKCGKVRNQPEILKDNTNSPPEVRQPLAPHRHHVFAKQADQATAWPLRQEEQAQQRRLTRARRRSEERRLGKECASTCRSRRSPHH